MGGGDKKKEGENIIHCSFKINNRGVGIRGKWKKSKK